MKKVFAALLALVMLLSVLPMGAFAAKDPMVPTVLRVGEYGKNMHNLIDRYDDEGATITVKSFKNAENYYTLDYEEGVGYVLTFYNAYENSSIVSSPQGLCGLYCDGDLTVRLAMTDSYAARHPSSNANITFDVNNVIDPDTKKPMNKASACGWVVSGTLTIESLANTQNREMASLIVNGDLESKDSVLVNRGIGIVTHMLLLNNVRLFVNGGNIGVKADHAVAMIDTYLSVNTARALRNDKGEVTFNRGIKAEYLIEARSSIAVPGDNTKLDIEHYYAAESNNSEMEADPIIYERNYEFDLPHSIKSDGSEGVKYFIGGWHSSFKMFRRQENIPECMYVRNPAAIATYPIIHKEYTFSWISIVGNTATIRRPTPDGGVELRLNLKCGKVEYTIDVARVIGTFQWWQYVPYFLSGDWIR